jgi:nitroreductase
VGGFNREAAIEILDVPDYVWPMLLITLGYPDEEPEAKPRRPMSEVAYLNSCNNPWEE